MNLVSHPRSRTYDVPDPGFDGEVHHLRYLLIVDPRRNEIEGTSFQM